MKKILLSCLCIALCGTYVFAQDLGINEAIKMYNEAAGALNSQEYAKALENAKQALEIIKTLDAEEAGELKGDIENLIPKISFGEARQLVVDKEYEKALVALQEASKAAELYNDANIKSSIAELLPQVMMGHANALLSTDKYAEAVEEYQKILAAEPNNETVYLRIGQAQSRLNNEAEAIAAFEKASELGSPEAEKQLGTVYLKKAAAASKDKNYKDALTNAQKTLEYDATNATAIKLLASAAVQLKNWDVAIPNLEKIIPSEKNPDNFIYNLAMAYDAKGNKAKACENFKKIVGNATFKAYAEAKVKELCN